VSEASTHLVFRLGETDYALRLDVVGRVLRMVAATPLPGAPACVRGVIDVAGTLMPLVDLRFRCGHGQRQAVPTDHLVLARTQHRPVALWVDAVLGLLHVAAGEEVPSQSVVPGPDMVRGLARGPDGLILIQDLDQLLSIDEEAALDRALAHRPDSDEAPSGSDAAASPLASGPEAIQNGATP